MQTNQHHRLLEAHLSLHQLVNNFLKNTGSLVSLTSTTVVNEIASEVVLEQGKDKLIPILHDLLITVLAHSRNGDIHITADRYRDIIILSIEERNNYNGYALACSLNPVEVDALTIGGHISIKDPCKKVATVSFSFPNYGTSTKAIA
jgi:hypothetical protein